MFSIIGVQYFGGSLRNKCILEFPANEGFTEEILEDHNQNQSNWYPDKDAW